MRELEKLKSIHQEHLLAFWDTLKSDQRLELSSDIENLNLPLFEKQKKALKVTPKESNYEPLTTFDTVGDPHFKKEGLRLVKEGKVASLLVAGGQGTRLGITGPKGCFLLTDKTLFQIYAEKVNQVGKKLPVFIMTSPLNHEETKSYFEKHEFFGLNIHFFCQGVYPLLTNEGNLFLSTPSTMAQGPNGNGTLFYHLVQEGLFDLMKHHGIESVNITLVDNPLANPFDFDLIGYRALQEADIAIKAIKRDNFKEKVGVLVSTKEGIRVVEYNEMNEEDFSSPKYSLANISLYCVSLPFILKAALGEHQLPIHCHNKQATGIYPGENALSHFVAGKSEKFIFDNFRFAKNIRTLVYPRDDVFAPIKDQASVDKARNLLLLKKPEK